MKLRHVVKNEDPATRHLVTLLRRKVEATGAMRFLGKFESAFATYLANRGLVTIGDFEEAQAIASIRAIEATTPSLEDGWRQATNFRVVNSATNFIMDDVRKTVGG